MLTTVQGQAGELRKGYRVAATLGPWTFTHAEKRITADVQDLNTVLIDNDAVPTSVRVKVGRDVWEWRDVKLEHNGTSATVWVEGDPTVRV